MTTSKSLLSDDVPLFGQLDFAKRELQAMQMILAATQAESLKKDIALEKAKRESETDELTGRHNLRYWNNEANGIWNRYAAPASEIKGSRKKGDLVLAFIDVNGLGKINKEYGDHIGDGLIKGAAEALASNFHRADDLKNNANHIDYIIARKGGDELMMLLPKTSVAFLTKAMEGINSSPAFDCHGVQIQMRCSYGLAVKSGPKTLQEAMVEADLKMQAYKATAPKSVIIPANIPQVA